MANTFLKIARKRWGRRHITPLLAMLLLLSPLLSSCNQSAPEADKEVRIGCMLPLSDVPSHQYGVWARQGIDLATEEINARGGIGGKRLTIDYQDDQGSGDEAVKVMNKFVNVNKYPVVFAYISQPSASVAPIARDTNTVLVTNTYTPGITENNGYVFRVGHNAGTDAKVMAEFLSKQFGSAPLAIFSLKTTAGDKAAEIIEKNYTALGGQVVGRVSYAADEKDLRSLLLKVKSLNPRIIYIYPYREVGTIVNEIRRLNINAVLASNNTVEQPNFFKDAGGAAEGLIFTTPRFDPQSTDQPVSTYMQGFQQKYGMPSEVSAATWYDTVKVVAQAIERGGYTAEGIRQALLQTREFPGVTGSITINGDGDVDKPVIVKVVKEGKFVPWDEVNK